MGFPQITLFSRKVVASTLAATGAVVLGSFLIAAQVGSGASAASASCSTPTHSGATGSMVCSDGLFTWPGTFVANTSSTTVAPTTTTSRPASTTTTTAPTQLTCTAFNTPTNVFTLNGVLGSPDQINTATPLLTIQTDGALASYTVTVDNMTLTSTVTNYTSSTACVKLPPLIDGVHIVSAQEISPNPQAVAPYMFLVDTTPPPEAVITSSSFSGSYVRMAGSGTPTFHISARDINAPGTGGAWVGTNGLWSVAYSRASGSHQLYVVQADKAGNESGPSNVVTVVVP